LFDKTTRVNLLIGTGHFFSHFYILTLPPLFFAWHETFDVSYAGLGASVALMAGTTAVLQTPAGYLVDKYGAKIFLIGGTALMAASVAAMAAATSYWHILVLATLSGAGNAVFHPADYSVLSGSIPRERLGRAFAFHLFTGHLGFALAPPIVVFLALTFGWRAAVLAVGLLGLPVVVAIILQSSILSEQPGDREGDRDDKDENATGSKRSAIFTRPMLLFFAFFMFGAMAQAGVQSWLITVLQSVNGISLEMASWALTAFVGGTVVGVLAGGWLADLSGARHLLIASVLITASAMLILAVGTLSLPVLFIVIFLGVSGSCFGASRVSRDIIVKNAAPRGQIGVVFGFVSAGLPLGQAITPVPFGYLIDQGYAEYVLVAVAAILMLSLLCGGGANLGARAAPDESKAE
jgi:FSR family fosmidomycin resistance protein-like MFS transporter